MSCCAVGAATLAGCASGGDATAGEALSSCIASSHDCSSMGMPSKGMGEDGGADSGGGDIDDGVDCSSSESPVGVDGGSRLLVWPPSPAQLPSSASCLGTGF